MKKFLFLVTFIGCINVFAQDTVVKKKFSLPTGIYYTSKSFFAKKPDIDRPFKVVTNYRNRVMGDSVPYGNTFEILDSTNISGFVFGFFDGKDMYINTEEQIRKDKSPLGKGIINTGIDKGGFFKMDKLGRHAYILSPRGFSIPVAGTPVGAVASLSAHSLMAVKAAVSVNELDLYYFNKKKKLLQATPTGVGFLLKEEKDLYEAYENEPKITTEVMIKYLDKMNERYPDL